MMSSASDVRSRTDDAWRAFWQALRQVELEVSTPSGWQGKEMLAHVAFWMETVPPFVTGAFRGKPAAFQVAFPSGYVAGDDDWPTADVHNAREAAWAREQPTDAVVARAERAYDELRTFLETVTDEEVAAHREYFSEIADHLDQHRLADLVTT
jgi:hypothetical protein